jgi:hypothetical protein
LHHRYKKKKKFFAEGRQKKKDPSLVTPHTRKNISIHSHSIRIISCK